MGLLKKIRKFFSSAIECPDKFAGDLFYIASLKKNIIKLGATLIVRKNFVAVLAVKGKVTDSFIEGKHKLILGAMPNTTRIINFERKKRDKKPKEKFRGEIYFVNLGEFREEFVGIEPFIIKDDNLGRAKVRANGEFSFNITDAKNFIEVCFLSWAYPKLKTVKRQMGYWVSAEVIKQLQRLNLPLLEFAQNNEYIAERLEEPVQKKFVSYGMNITNIKLTETFIPNKFAESLQKLQEESRESLLKYDAKNDATYIPDYNNMQISTSNKYYQDDEDDEYENSYESFEQNNFNNINEHLPVFNELKQSSEHVLVDEDIEYLTKFTKICVNCNARIAKDAIACYNCGAKQQQKRVCLNCNAEVPEGEFVCPNCKSIII